MFLETDLNFEKYLYVCEDLKPVIRLETVHDNSALFRCPSQYHLKTEKLPVKETLHSF